MRGECFCGFAVVKDFVLIGQHTCPKNAMKEIDQLYNVFTTVRKKWKTDVGQAGRTFPDGFIAKNLPVQSQCHLCVSHTPSRMWRSWET